MEALKASAMALRLIMSLTKQNCIYIQYCCVLHGQYRLYLSIRNAETYNI